MEHDDLQHGINEAAQYFYRGHSSRSEVVSLIETKSPKREKHLRIRYMNPTMMIGVGYLVGKGHLKYRGDHHYSITGSGFDYYVSLVRNDDIKDPAIKFVED
jgi:hypothetical protein